jgi:predicted permease
MFAPLNLGERARLVMGHVVTANHFEMLGVRPFLGRLLQPDDDRPDAEPVVVISYRMWRSEFGGDPAIAGKTLTLRGRPYVIAGVAPESFTGVVPLFAPELWLPIAHNEEVEPAGINSNVPSPTGRTRLERRGSRWLFVKGRLQPGRTLDQARANLALIGEQLAAEHPATNRDARLTAYATKEVRLLVPQATGVLSIGSMAVMAIVGLVLLIACANVAGMLLARASSRRREMAVRRAVGASRGQIVRQLLCEGVVLGAGGALVAAALAWAVVRLLASIPLPFPGVTTLTIPIDGRMAAFTAVVALAAGVLAALTPALTASSPQIAADLRGDRPAAHAAARRWSARDLLVAGQLSLTAFLLVIGALLVRSLDASRSADVGLRVRGVASVSADTDIARYSGDRSRQFWEQALQRIRGLPGVTSAALVSPRLPFDVNFNQTTIRVEGASHAPEERGVIVSHVSVTPDYFRTLDIPLVEGRAFTDADRQGAPLVAVINETMARRLWPGRSAVGGTFEIASAPGVTYTVVGIAKDHRVHTVAERPTPYLHFPAAQRPSAYNHIVAHTSGDAGQLLAAMRRELLALEPGLVFISSSTMEATMAMSLLPERFGAWLATAFGALGTLLAAIGLYGVIAYSVARRTREIGVRMAVGASGRAIVALILGQGATLLMVGAGVGLLLAAIGARALRGMLYGIAPYDAVAWGAAIGIMTIAALAANLGPAVRALRVNPVEALRAD